MSGTPIPGAPGTPGTVPLGSRVRYWHGNATGRYWAMLPWPWSEHGYRLVEAKTVDDLAGQVRHLLEGMTVRDDGMPRARGN
ncbi:hypothetical protein AGRA3207_006687 [Actinomadura graeca]|uniref:Uncharacterized protein n=1 Tax=Actinomadura graeca TaxID=2750812 RepID=A0ABX8R437_9ACTN|nr:hypothetical protein [Actinomadura graeca]QXJ25219.1 hypothetical protein AGRA3207_006687 [Actinomadura graeca]